MELDTHEFNEESTLLSELQKRNIRAFMRLYRNYSEELLIFTYGQLLDRQLAVKTVDEFFEDLWEAAKFKEITPPIYKYLITQLRGICDLKQPRS